MRLFIYIEVLVLATIYRVICIPLGLIIDELALLGRTAETYSKLNCHFWQQNKVHERYLAAKEAYLKTLKGKK